MTNLKKWTRVIEIVGTPEFIEKAKTTSALPEAGDVAGQAICVSSVVIDFSPTQEALEKK